MSTAKIAVAQLGAREDYAIPLALQKGGYLARFYTDTYLRTQEAQLLQSLGQLKFFKSVSHRFLARYHPALQSSQSVRFNTLGLRYLWTIRQAKSSEDLYRAFISYGQAFNQAILASGLGEITHLYAFDHAALDLFQQARRQGAHCILNQIYPAIYEELLEEEEEMRWPNWLAAPRIPFFRSATFQEWKEIQRQEWDLSDLIIVNSEYSRQAILTVAPELATKLKVVPLTVNFDVYKPYQQIREYQNQRPLNLLFAGSVNLRKGMPYLLEVISKLKPSIARLKVAGTLQLHPDKLVQSRDRVEFLGPVPYVQMAKLYQEADLLILPTVSDGFGAVMLEAMATGLPVIATDHCGDIVEDGINGYRIPIRDSEAITQKVLEIYERPELLTHLSQGAVATCQRYAPQAYQSHLYQALDLPLPNRTF